MDAHGYTCKQRRTPLSLLCHSVSSLEMGSFTDPMPGYPTESPRHPLTVCMCHHTWPVFLLLFLKTLNATTIEGKAVLLFLPHREEATAEKLRTGLGECCSDLRGQHKA